MTRYTVDDVRIEAHAGDRTELRDLFALAEDSPIQLDAYLYDGRILVARRGSQIVGHLQLVAADVPEALEIKNMAVLEAEQGRGIGARLVRAALDLAAADAGAGAGKGAGAVTTMLVATAAADVGNLRFYQRQGFRLRSVDRDAFTPATGYPSRILIDGIELRDRVWLDQPVPPTDREERR
jgi:GNAT superfamily N-acetyltransferase